MVTGKGHRCVVPGHRGGKSVVLSDQRLRYTMTGNWPG
jgi:hypothetical protein